MIFAACFILRGSVTTGGPDVVCVNIHEHGQNGMSLSKGISNEIEVAMIAIDEMMILRYLKRGSHCHPFNFNLTTIVVRFAPYKGVQELRQSRILDSTPQIPDSRSRIPDFCH